MSIWSLKSQCTVSVALLVNLSLNIGSEVYTYCVVSLLKGKSKTRLIGKIISLTCSFNPNDPNPSVSWKTATALCGFGGLSPCATRGKMTIVDTGCWPKAISPLWPNSPQRCKHYMGEWPTDRPQRLQSEGQWFVQQPIREVCVPPCECLCVSVGACAIGEGRRAATEVNWT